MFNKSTIPMPNDLANSTTSALKPVDADKTQENWEKLETEWTAGTNTDFSVNTAKATNLNTAMAAANTVGTDANTIVRAASLYVGGGLVDTSSLDPKVNGIISGNVVASSGGFPDYLTEGGAASLTATLDTTTSFVGTVAGTGFTLTSDVEFTCSAGWDANNTCLVNEALYAADEVFSKTEGEFGDTFITVDAAGSEITGAVGEKHFFKIAGAATEIMYALISSATKLIPIYRGLAGTSRTGMTNNDTITILKATHLFIDSSGNPYMTTVHPTQVGATLPSAGTSGLYIYRRSDNKWYYDSGITVTETSRLWVGVGLCSNSTDNDYVAYIPDIHDYVKSWKEDIDVKLEYISATTVKIKAGSYVNIAGVEQKLLVSKSLVLSTAGDRDSGVSEAASTMYYVYGTPDGDWKISNVCPRPLGEKLGLYHPLKYWRCIGTFFNDSGSNIVPFVISKGVYKYAFTNGIGTLGAESAFDLVSPATGYKTNVFTSLPPFVLTAEIYYRNNTNAQNVYEFRRGQAFGYLVGNYTNSITYVLGPFLAQNSTIPMGADTASQIYLGIHSFLYNL